MGRRGEEAKISLMGEMGEDGATIEAGERGNNGKMAGGKFVPVALMKETRARRRGLEDQRGNSRPTSVRPWRRGLRLSAVEG